MERYGTRWILCDRTPGLAEAVYIEKCPKCGFMAPFYTGER